MADEERGDIGLLSVDNSSFNLMNRFILNCFVVEIFSLVVFRNRILESAVPHNLCNCPYQILWLYYHNYTIFAHGPHHAKMYLRAYADNEGPDQTAHPRSLIRAFAVR